MANSVRQTICIKVERAAPLILRPIANSRTSRRAHARGTEVKGLDKWNSTG